MKTANKQLKEASGSNHYCISNHYGCTQWRLVAFINGGASKTIIKMSKSFIRRLPKFKGGKNKFLAKNAIFDIDIVVFASEYFDTIYWNSLFEVTLF